MTEPRLFRKLPIIVKAAFYDGSRESAADIITWTEGAATLTITNDLAIPTLEGTMTCGVGDWVIQGVSGEFYPCKPGVFSETYVELNGDSVPAPMVAT